jgi:hypothetical protein
VLALMGTYAHLSMYYMCPVLPTAVSGLVYFPLT